MYLNYINNNFNLVIVNLIWLYNENKWKRKKKNKAQELDINNCDEYLLYKD